MIPLAELPGGIRAVARLLPAAPLAEILNGTIGVASAVPGRAWAVLAVWAVAAPLAASRLFRWE